MARTIFAMTQARATSAVLPMGSSDLPTRWQGLVASVRTRIQWQVAVVVGWLRYATRVDDSGAKGRALRVTTTDAIEVSHCSQANDATHNAKTRPAV